VRDRVWVTKDGRKLLVAQMETGHIERALEMIKANNWRRRYQTRLELELEIRRQGLRK
jgi:hypothetical protein